MKRIVLFFFLAPILFSSCNLFSSYGKKVSINDKNSVYYKGEGVTESDARKLGDYLKQIGYFNGSQQIDVQLTREGDAYTVRFPVKEDALAREHDQLDLVFWYWQDLISENVFNGKKTNVILTDNKLKDVTAMDDLNKVEVGKGHYVYLKGNSVKEKDAKEIGEKLENEKFMTYTDGNVLLTKVKGVYNLSFLPSEGKLKESKDHYYQTLKNFQYLLGKYVLDGEEVKLHLLADDFTIAREFDEISPELKAQLDQALQPQQQQQTDPNTQQTNYNTQNQTDTIVGGGY